MNPITELADCACQNWTSTTIEELIDFADYTCITGSHDFERCEFDEHRIGIRYLRNIAELIIHVYEIWVETQHGWVHRTYYIRKWEEVIDG